MDIDFRSDVHDDTRTAPQLRASLGTAQIIFMVLATAAPMAAVLGVLPVAFGLGSGAGLPLIILAAGVVLWFFSIGYTAMSRRIVNAGAFYTYVVRGVGPIPGLGAAFLAIISYVAFVCGAVGYFGYFAQSAAQDLLGLHLAWGWYSIAALFMIAILGYRQIDFSSRVLAVLLTVEFGILTALAASIVWSKGVSAFPHQSMSFHQATSGHPGIALMFAFTCFIGFESAALYSEEARDPRRSVARATYGSLAIIVLFYVLMSWVTVGAIGTRSISRVANESGGSMYFGLSDHYLAHWVTNCMEVFLATSIFATCLALHNVSSRYVFSLGRQACLPRVLGVAHPRHQSPHVASTTVSGVTTLIVVVCLASGAGSLIGLGTVGIGLGTVGIIALQAVTSVAVTAYLRREHRLLGAWTTTIAPLLGSGGLWLAVYLAIQKFDLLSGGSNRWINAGAPAVLAAALLGGLVFGAWLRSARPTVYADLKDDLS